MPRPQGSRSSRLTGENGSHTLTRDRGHWSTADNDRVSLEERGNRHQHNFLNLLKFKFPNGIFVLVNMWHLLPCYHRFDFWQCCQVKNLQMAKMGSKYGQKWPDLGFANGQLNGQLFVLYSALKRSNLEQKIAWEMCKDIRKINIPTKPWIFQSYERSIHI